MLTLLKTYDDKEIKDLRLSINKCTLFCDDQRGLVNEIFSCFI